MSERASEGFVAVPGGFTATLLEFLDAVDA